jgi:hypothetical protein
MSAIVAFLRVYLPMLGVMTGFAFAEKNRTQGQAGANELSLMLAGVLVGVQAFGPGLLLLVLGDIESVLAMLKAADLGSQPIALGAVTYFYSKR